MWQQMMAALPEGFVKWGPPRSAEDTQAVDEDVLPIDAHEERIMRCTGAAGGCAGGCAPRAPSCPGLFSR